MKTQTRLRAAVATTVSATALAFVAGVAASTPAQADPLCYGAGVTGTITGTHGVGPTCVSTPLPALCGAPVAGISPTIGVWVVACVPD
jgi:uncharacterized membrane protein